MQVRVTSRSLVLDRPDDCAAVTLFLEPDASHVLSSLLAAHGAGVMVGEDVLLSVNWIRAESSGQRGIGWNHRFAHMLLHAAERGDLTENGSVLRTVITRPQDPRENCRLSEISREVQGGYE